VHVKGPDLLLEALRRLVVQLPSVRLCFVGSGDMMKDIRVAVHHAGLDDHVQFADRAQRSEVAGWLRRSRVLALPSRSEGLPLAAIEAQLLGVPVVAHAVGGVPQAVADGSTGLLVALGDADAFASALERLLTNDEEWTEFSTRAAEWARTRFDPALMARRYKAIYAAALQGKSCADLELLDD
jgi:glycosyltransferase involved in cell wall biosynthesis